MLEGMTVRAPYLPSQINEIIMITETFQTWIVGPNGPDEVVEATRQIFSTPELQ